MPVEIDAILTIAERWGPVDRSHRKVAHRGSYEQTVWVSPSTFRRVLAAHGLVVPELPPRPRSAKKPWPDWLVWAPNRIWAWDVTHFTAARRCVFAIVDLVSRKWIDTLMSIEETSTQVTVIFEHALEVEGLIEFVTPERLDLAADDPARPILLAVSDNGPQMTSDATRVHGRDGGPATPRPAAHADRSSLDRDMFGHVKHEWPHLETITDPAVLDVELAREGCAPDHRMRCLSCTRLGPVM